MDSFLEFMNKIVVESLHPELKDIVTGPLDSARKHLHVVKKIKELAGRGEKTGIEGNMPKGSSRAYMPHSEHHQTTVDGKPASFKIGTKIAIKAPLDHYHDKSRHDGMSLGELQNSKENGDHLINSSYRILTKEHDSNNYTSNKEHGIFPPIVDHDHKGHQWSTVGHSRDIRKGEFRALTKSDTHPKGISHRDFTDALSREYHRDNGRYWEQGSNREKHLDHVTSHPLVERFLDHQKNYGVPPADYQQKKNMGVFEHPDGSHHIVARDHGFDNEVSQAYGRARTKKEASRYGGEPISWKPMRG